MRRETVLSLAGIVRAADTDLPLHRARVEILAGPPPFEQLRTLRQQQHGALWRQQMPRLDCTQTRQDGSFVFVNLPPGAYQVRVTAPGIYYEAATSETMTVSEPGEAPPPPVTIVLSRKPNL